MNSEIALEIRSRANYASLDEYIRWDECRINGGRETGIPKSLLEHLDHVYTFTSTKLGPSVFEKILEIIDDLPGKFRDLSWRRLNKRLGSRVTRVWCSKLRVPVDDCYETVDPTHKMQRFLIGLERCCLRQPSRHPWSLEPDIITELSFYQDPSHSSARPDAWRMTHYRGLVNGYKQRKGTNRAMPENFQTDPEWQRLYRAYVDEYRDYSDGGRVMDPDKITFIWAQIIAIIPSLPNLKTFRWLSTMPIAESIVDILCHDTPNLTTLALTIVNNPIEDATLVAIVADIFDSLDQEGRMFLRLSNDCDVSVRLAPRCDANLRTALHRLSQRTTHLEYLEIDRSISDEGFGMETHGHNPGPEHQELGIKRMTVNALKLVSTGYANITISSALDLHYLRSLELERCEFLEYILDGVPEDGKHLTCLKISYPPTSRVSIRPRAYWERIQYDKESVLLFITRNKSPLADITIRAPYIDGVYQNWGLSEPRPLGNQIEGRDLIDALQHHAISLVRLDVLHSGINFLESDLGRIGTLLPNVAHLRISLRRTTNISDYDPTEQLYKALRTFKYPHVEFALTLSYRGPQTNPHDPQNMEAAMSLTTSVFASINKALQASHRQSIKRSRVQFWKDIIPLRAITYLSQPRYASECYSYTIGINPKLWSQTRYMSGQLPFLKLVSHKPLQCVVGENDALTIDRFYDAFETAEESALERVAIERPPRIFHPVFDYTYTPLSPPDFYMTDAQRAAGLTRPLHASLGPPGAVAISRPENPWAAIEDDDTPLPIPGCTETLESDIVGGDEDGGEARVVQRRVLRRPDGSQMGRHFQSVVVEGKNWALGFDGSYLRERGSRFGGAIADDGRGSRVLGGNRDMLGRGAITSVVRISREKEKERQSLLANLGNRSSGWGPAWLIG